MKRSEAENRIDNWLEGTNVITGKTILDFLDTILLKAKRPKFDPEESGPYFKKLTKLHGTLFRAIGIVECIYLTGDSKQKLDQEFQSCLSGAMTIYGFINLKISKNGIDLETYE